MQPRGFRPAIANREPDQDIVWRILSIFSKHIEVSVVIKDACIRKLKFSRLKVALSVLVYQPGIGEFRLRIFVEGSHIGMRRSRIQIEIAFLDVLAVIPFGAGQTE